MAKETLWDTTPVKLTDAIVRALPAPTDRGYRIKWDTTSKGFGLRITRAGARSFVLRDRVNGDEHLVTIGSFPAWTVKDARTRANKLKQKFEGGEDVVAAKRAKDAGATVNDLADRYIAEHVLVKLRPRTAITYQRIIAARIRPAWGTLKVAAVTTDHIDKLHATVSVTALYHANRVHAVASKMFTLAVRWGMRADNPCRGVARNKEYRREKYLTPAQIVRLGEVLAEHPNRAGANAVRLLLLTGARRSEVLGARWSEFDLAGAMWHKPRARTKTDIDQHLPLSAPVVALLTQMKAEAGSSPFLFPGKPGEPVHDIKAFWQRVRDAAGLQGFRLHDLRHTYASVLVSAGFSLPLIGSLLGHRNPVTTARYAHLMDDPLRRAVEEASAAITGNGESGEVVPLKRRG